MGFVVSLIIAIFIFILLWSSDNVKLIFIGILISLITIWAVKAAINLPAVDKTHNSVEVLKNG